MERSHRPLRPLKLLRLLRGIVWGLGMIALPMLSPALSDASQFTMLKIGVREHAPPLSFRDRAGELVGFEVDLARAIADRLGVSQLELMPIKNRDRFTALFSQKVDLVIAQVTVTPNRARLVDFTLPYYTDRTVTVTNLETYDSRLGLRQFKAIGVLKGSSAIAALQSVYQGQVIGADSYRSLYQALALGKVEAIAADYLGLATWLHKNPTYGIVGQPLAFYSLAIAVPRGVQHQALFTQTTKALADLQASGWLQQRAKYWRLPE